MDIVYFGSDVFLGCFTYLSERHHIRALYTYHNDEDYVTEFGIVKRAREMGIPVHYEAVSPEATRQYFKDGCELYFVAEYNRIIEIPEDLDSFRGVNVHSSVLPEGRSYYPIESAMAQGLPRTGVTIHELKPRLDSGAILAQRTFDITPDMDSVDVYLRCGAYAREMTEEVFRDFDAAWNADREQRQRCPYWKRPARELMTLRHDMTRAEAADVFRCFNAMTQVLLDGRWHFVSALMSGPTALGSGEWQLTPDRWLYAVRDGHLRLNVHPMEGDS